MSSLFTCITCRVAFANADIQRDHYKTDWHRYNLKRKVAELPPVTTEEFQRRVIVQRGNDELNQKDKSIYCKSCRKSFCNDNAYTNHLNSKKHRENELFCLNKDEENETSSEQSVEKVLEEEPMEDEEIEEVDSDDWDSDTENPIDNNDCIFCSHHSRTMFKNLKHMTEVHSFFIPDAEFCVDIKGLLSYLGEKVFNGFMCLWCNEKGKSFHSAAGAQMHMLDKGHCKMIHEGISLAEYADFYDYSASYPDAKDTNIDVDEDIETSELDGSDYQLVLPSGFVVGHRSLMRYYKQSLNPNKAVVPVSSSKKLHKVLAHYRSLGWSATQQAAAARNAKDIHYMKRLQSKWYSQLGTKANKLQTHFRPQVNF